jgi:hypothetical protein
MQDLKLFGIAPASWFKEQVHGLSTKVKQSSKKLRNHPKRLSISPPLECRNSIFSSATVLQPREVVFSEDCHAALSAASVTSFQEIKRENVHVVEITRTPSPVEPPIEKRKNVTDKEINLALLRNDSGISAVGSAVAIEPSPVPSSLRSSTPSISSIYSTGNPSLLELGECPLPLCVKSTNTTAPETPSTVSSRSILEHDSISKQEQVTCQQLSPPVVEYHYVIRHRRTGVIAEKGIIGFHYEPKRAKNIAMETRTAALKEMREMRMGRGQRRACI